MTTPFAEALQVRAGTAFGEQIMITLNFSFNGQSLTCNSSCIDNGDTSWTLSDNIPSLRHCHHSQLIGGARKETSHTVECLV